MTQLYVDITFLSIKNTIYYTFICLFCLHLPLLLVNDNSVTTNRLETKFTEITDSTMKYDLL